MNDKLWENFDFAGVNFYLGIAKYELSIMFLGNKNCMTPFHE